MTSKITVGTRSSKLALIQVQEVHDLINKISNNKIEVVVSKILTSGDRLSWDKHDDGGVKGMFTKEIDKKLLDGSIDIAVHSLKDVASELPSDLVIAAVLPREDPSDAFVSNKYKHIDEMPSGSTIGTSSLRRSLFLKAYKSDINIIPYRGNMLTRLDNLDQNKVDATIMATSGLNRLGLSKRICSTIDRSVMLPAIAQGVIGILTKKDNPFIEILKEINCKKTMTEVLCERMFAEKFGANCKTPIGAYAQVNGNSISLEGSFFDQKQNKILRISQTGSIENIYDISFSVAEKITKMRI